MSSRSPSSASGSRSSAAAGGVVGGLEPPDELVEGVHHLLGETLAHLVLVLAAVLEESGEPLSARQREEALLGEEEAEGGAEGAPGGEAHVRDAEVHPAGALAARSGDEAKRDAVEEQAGGNPGAPEQALGTALGRGFEARTGAAGYRRVEVLPVVECLDEELPRRLTVARVALADGEVGAEGLAVVREGNLQLGRNGSLLRARVPAGREAPVEDGGGELAEVGDAGLRTARRVELALLDATGETVLPLRVLPVQDRPRLRERRGGDHQAVRLDEAEPFEVGARVGVGVGHVRRVAYPARHRVRSPRSRRWAAVTSLFSAVVYTLPRGFATISRFLKSAIRAASLVKRSRAPLIRASARTCSSFDLHMSLWRSSSARAFTASFGVERARPDRTAAPSHRTNPRLWPSSRSRSPPTTNCPRGLASQSKKRSPDGGRSSPNTSCATLASIIPHIRGRPSAALRP